jgi:formylglycine-generating enzyme required for sulfatase activity
MVLSSCLGGCSGVLGLTPGSASQGQCDNERDCAPDEKCHKSHCLPKCEASSDCDADERCEDGACSPTGDRCLSGDRRCHESIPQECTDDGDWNDIEVKCPMACQAGKCIVPNSCTENPTCGESGASCCESLEVPGGTFELEYQGRAIGSSTIERSVEAFSLDRFEVTVARFYQFLTAYASARNPSAGSGKTPGVPDSGWNSEWSRDAMLVPPSAESLVRGMSACGPIWMAESDLPARCVNWYAALAFCIWDGGRLPSEAEWTFAASGGDDLRDLPWSMTVSEDSFTQDYACYRDDANRWDAPQRVGYRPKGAGKLGQEDLIGNVSEWVADTFHENPQADVCPGDAEPEADCTPEFDTNLRTIRGGSFALYARMLSNHYRTNDDPARRDPTLGFRCARDLTATE